MSDKSLYFVCHFVIAIYRHLLKHVEYYGNGAVQITKIFCSSDFGRASPYIFEWHKIIQHITVGAIITEFSDYFKIVFKDFDISYAVVIGNSHFQTLRFDSVIKIYYTAKSHVFYRFPCRCINISGMCSMVLLYYCIQLET